MTVCLECHADLRGPHAYDCTAYVPTHRRCPRHDLHDRAAACDPHCLNPARYYEALGEL